MHQVLCNGNEVVSPQMPFLATEIHICASAQRTQARILMTTTNFKTTIHGHKHFIQCVRC